MHLPTLYKKTSTGADQEWTILVKGNKIVTRWGQCGGKIQETEDIITEGKNLGKANETNPYQQANAEAQSQWEKKLKKGYVQDLKDAQKGKVDEVIEGGIFPMLAKKYSEHADKIKWPAYVQPKFDGHRCIAIVKDGKCTLWSRTRKLINSVPHINKELVRVFGKQEIVLDGELYNHEYKTKFEELTSLIRQEEPKEGYEAVQYHVYDIVTNQSFSKRNDILSAIFYQDAVNDKIVRGVTTLLVRDENDILLAFETFLAQGYEGLMVRNAEGLYVNKRSSDLLKVKTFDDSEFRIVGIEEGRGKLTGCAIFVCETAADLKFNVKMKGDTAKLKEYFDKPKSVIGKILTVQYQGLTKTGVPRFPIGLRFRKDV